MNINQLSEIVKKKIFENQSIEEVYLEDKSFLHKNHKNNDPKKFHIKLMIKSEKLKKMNQVQSNRLIFKILENEIRDYIHSLQILIT